MKFLFVSDLHAALRLPYAKLDPGGVHSDRLRDVISIIDQVRDAAQNGDADGVFILGDLFDQSNPSGPALIHTCKALKELSEVCPLYLLSGNHGSIDREGRLYNLQFLDQLKIPGIRVLGHETLDLTPGLRFHALPWLPEARAAKRIRRISTKMNAGDQNILLMHQGVYGAEWDSGKKAPDGLRVSTFENFDRVLTGHYHRPQTFGGHGQYLGSPLDLRFGDEDVVYRGFWQFDADEDCLSKVPTHYPRFCTWTMGVSEEENYVKFSWDIEYLRVIMKGKAEEVDTMMAFFSDWVDRQDFRSVKVITLIDRPVRQRIFPDGSSDVPSLSQMAAMYADHHDAGEESLRLGLELLEDS